MAGADVVARSMQEFSSMTLDKWTQKAQHALQAAQTAAQERSHAAFDSEHLALALVTQADGIVPPLLEKAGVEVSRLVLELEAELGRRPTVQGGADVYPSTDLQAALKAALAEATPDGARWGRCLSVHGFASGS